MDYNTMSLYNIFDIMEERYGICYNIEDVIVSHPDDQLMQYYYERLTTFEVWESKRILFNHLDDIGKTMFISMTDQYGTEWNLLELLRKNEDDALLKEFSSYLDYLDRVASLYSFLKQDGYDLSTI